MSKTRCAEPSLDELFGDIAVQLLMRRDGVRESDIRSLLGQVKQAWAATLGGDRVQAYREISKQS